MYNEYTIEMFYYACYNYIVIVFRGDYMKNRNKKMIVIISLIVALLIIVISVALTYHFKKNDFNIEVNSIQKVKTLSSENSSEAAELIKRNIVKVTNKVDDFEIIGTGFFHETGYLITNSHVVDIKGNITIEYYDGTEDVAKLVSNDIMSDIALLTVENPKILAMNFGNTLNLKVTDEVFAIGYPFGIEGEASVVKGILSARRSAGGIEFLQTDMSLNTGFSGGPLIDKKGNLLGINSYATENATIGMSISVENLESIITKLVNNKQINYLEEERPQNVLGIILTEIGFDTKDMYDELDYFNNKNKKEDKLENSQPENNNNDDNKRPSLSNINTLESLEISNYSISFNKNTTRYTITLKNKETSLNISAKTTDNKATYSINGNSNLKPGSNDISIIVKAENGKTMEYVINAIIPVTKVERAVGIIGGLDIEYNSRLGTNCFHQFWDYKDSDGVRLYPGEYADVFNSVTVEVYKGWSENDSSVDAYGNPVVLLKTYQFSPTSLNQTSIYIYL